MALENSKALVILKAFTNFQVARFGGGDFQSPLTCQAFDMATKSHHHDNSSTIRVELDDCGSSEDRSIFRS